MLGATNVQLAVYEGLEKAGVRRDQQVMGRILHELLCAGVLSMWTPVIITGLGGALEARTFFALWAWMWLCMFVIGILITWCVPPSPYLPKATLSPGPSWCVLTRPRSTRRRLLRVLGPALGNMVHTIVLILNLTSSQGVNATEVMPDFFRIGIGLPFFQAVQGSRHIVMGAYDRMGRNVGVLFGWLGFLLIAPTLVCLHHRRVLRRKGVLK